MKYSKHGFTLIELLIVVLIIGILAAIALPQYQKAVLKSRFSSLMPLAKALSDSEEAYYLEHGTYTEDKTKLDVTTTDANASVTLGNENQHQYVKLTRSDIKNQLTIYQKHSPNFAGETHCEALIDSTLANWLCADSLKGTYIGNKYGYSVYSLSEESVGSLARTYYNLPRWSQVEEGDTCISTRSNTCIDVNVNGGTCIGYQFVSCGGHTVFTNNATCIGRGGDSCGSGSFQNHSVCKAEFAGSCYWAQFNDSFCYGDISTGCGGGKFTNNSICYANVDGSCSGRYGVNPTYTGNSSCVGDAINSCRGGAFTESSICYANANGACAGNTYDDTSYCSGSYCPAGARKENGTLWQVDENGNSY